MNNRPPESPPGLPQGFYQDLNYRYVPLFYQTYPWPTCKRHGFPTPYQTEMTPYASVYPRMGRGMMIPNPGPIYYGNMYNNRTVYNDPAMYQQMYQERFYNRMPWNGMINHRPVLPEYSRILYPDTSRNFVTNEQGTENKTSWMATKEVNTDRTKERTGNRNSVTKIKDRKISPTGRTKRKFDTLFKHFRDRTKEIRSYLITDRRGHDYIIRPRIPQNPALNTIREEAIDSESFPVTTAKNVSFQQNEQDITAEGKNDNRQLIVENVVGDVQIQIKDGINEDTSVLNLPKVYNQKPLTSEDKLKQFHLHSQCYSYVSLNEEVPQKTTSKIDMKYSEDIQEDNQLLAAKCPEQTIYPIVTPIVYRTNENIQKDSIIVTPGEIPETDMQQKLPQVIAAECSTIRCLETNHQNLRDKKVTVAATMTSMLRMKYNIEARENQNKDMTKEEEQTQCNLFEGTRECSTMTLDKIEYVHQTEKEIKLKDDENVDNIKDTTSMGKHLSSIESSTSQILDRCNNSTMNRYGREEQEIVGTSIQIETTGIPEKEAIGSAIQSNTRCTIGKRGQSCPDSYQKRKSWKKSLAPLSPNQIRGNSIETPNIRTNNSKEVEERSIKTIIVEDTKTAKDKKDSSTKVSLADQTQQETIKDDQQQRQQINDKTEDGTQKEMSKAEDYDQSQKELLKKERALKTILRKKSLQILIHKLQRYKSDNNVSITTEEAQDIVTEESKIIEVVDHAISAVALDNLGKKRIDTEENVLETKENKRKIDEPPPEVIPRPDTQNVAGFLANKESEERLTDESVILKNYFDTNICDSNTVHTPFITVSKHKNETENDTDTTSVKNESGPITPGIDTISFCKWENLNRNNIESMNNVGKYSDIQRANQEFLGKYVKEGKSLHSLKVINDLDEDEDEKSVTKKEQSNSSPKKNHTF